MDSETASSSNELLLASVVAGSANDNRGKHRILAELKHLQQEITFLEEELAELEKSENVSTICAELLTYIETRQDALLPTTNGPLNISWDRWFEGEQEAKGCRCSIL